MDDFITDVVGNLIAGIILEIIHFYVNKKDRQSK